MNNRVNGVVVGRVRKVNDPAGEGRILIEFPWMEGRNQSYWAPPATLMSGGGRGAWFMPEQGDEVLVAFDHGDVNHPYIVGFLWNGVDKPPRTDPALRTIQTVSGHVLEFDDNGGKEKISLLFKGDTPSVILEEKSATIKTASGHEVKLDDESGESVSIQWKGGDPSITSRPSSHSNSTARIL
jgi:uncharacterized protein involved in type VI secretion and phage assembly